MLSQYTGEQQGNAYRCRRSYIVYQGGGSVKAYETPRPPSIFAPLNYRTVTLRLR